MADAPKVRAISECFIKPKQIVEESNKPFYLGSAELMQLSQCHLQIGLLFPKHPSKDNGVGTMDSFLDKLKHSMSSTLTHFYPLAGSLHQVEFASLCGSSGDVGLGVLLCFFPAAGFLEI